MPYTTTNFQPPTKLNTYLNNQVLGATPEQLLLMLYDIAISSCQKKDSQKASQALVELMGALNFEYEDIALGLFRLYQYCLDQVKKQQFDETLILLKDLKTTWELALKNYKR